MRKSAKEILSCEDYKNSETKRKTKESFNQYLAGNRERVYLKGYYIINSENE